MKRTLFFATVGLAALILTGLARSWWIGGRAAAGALKNATVEGRKFILARCRAAAQFTEDLWHSAWRRSASMPKPY